MDNLKDLAKWQAASHADLAERKPGELFQPEFAERYTRLHEDLWGRIVHLHGTIHTLEQMEHFPFDRLYGPNHMEFWRLVARNFVEMAIVLLHGLVNDQEPAAHTIRRFKNEIARGPWLDQRLRDLLMQTLRGRKFDRHAERVAERVERIRHHRIAHRLIDKQTGYLKEQLAGVSLEELRALFNAAHSLFGALSFGSAYVTLAGDLMPGTVRGEPARTCLDEVLDAVIRDSHFVNQPERDRRWWATHREHMPAEELKTVNELRKRVGLPEA
jgi:hypothetical protein